MMLKQLETSKLNKLGSSYALINIAELLYINWRLQPFKKKQYLIYQVE